MIGEIVGEYRIVSPLAPGGVGDVYLGEHTTLGTRAAIEIMHPQLAASTEAAQQYVEEVRTVGKIKHAGTMKIIDAGVDAAGRNYVIQEILDGDTLARRIESSGRLSVTQIGEIGRQLANVLAATHDEGLVHGDLRPDAIFLMRAGGLARGEPLKVIEFGVARLKRAVGVVIGPVYTAPELLGSGATIDWRVDAYGLGCVAFEMATGRPPFSGANADEVRAKHLEQSPPAARSHMPDVTPALDMLIGRLLSKRPEDRFSSMREIARTFEALGGGGSSRPLAPTANEMPALVMGEMSGEIKARPSQPDHPPEAPAAAAPSPMPKHEASVIAPDATAVMSKRKRSKAPLLIVLAVIVIAGSAVGIALGMRGGSSEASSTTGSSGKR